MAATASPTMFVGREEELGLLSSRLEQALSGTGNLVFLSAEPGAGKTTLTSHFLEQVTARHPEALVIRATCSEQYGAGEPYQPFVEAFRKLALERDQREESAKGRSFRDLAKQIAPFWIAAIPVAGEAIAAGISTAERLRQQFQGAGGNTAPSEEALFFQYTELFLAAANESPLVLFLDDLHWADRATVSLLTHLGRRIGDQRVLILGTYRPTEVDTARHPMRDARQELQRYRVAEELSLKPLGSQALADLVLLRTGATPSPQLFDWLEKRAGSNALFFDELLDWLVSHGLTRENHGELQLVRVPQEVEIPRSAESTIEKRLDRLDEETRRILEYASVQGNEFDSVGLSRLLDKDELELEEALEPIARTHRLIQLRDTVDLPNGDMASVYHFSHSLIQHVLHNGLQGKRRILLHRKMAQILEDVYGQDKAPVARRLATHFEEGRLSGQAYEYALVAAERASRVYAHWDALEQIQRALRNAADDDERQAEAWLRLGEARVAIAQYTDALTAFDEALQRIDSASKPARSIHVRRRRVLVESMQGLRSVDEVRASLKALREEARSINDRFEECQIIWHMIDLPGTTDSMDGVLAREALELAEQLEDRWMLARGHEVLGVALAFSSSPQSAIDELQRAVTLYGELGDRSREAGCRSNLALARVFLGDMKSGAHEFDATIQIFDEIVDPMRGAAIRSNLGALLRILGEYDSAETRLRESIRFFERLGGTVRLISPLMNLAEVHEARGEWNEAEVRWIEMLHHARETGYRGEQMIAHCGIGTARLRLGDLQGAIAAEKAARAIMSADPDSIGEGGEALQLFSARLAAASGETEGALGMLDRLEAAAASRDRYLAAIYQLEKAEILARLSPQDALPLARKAHSELETLGARPGAERAEQLIARLS